MPKQFETIVASAPRENLVYRNKITNTPIAANTGYEVISFYASPGTIAEIQAVTYACSSPIGAANGTEVLNVRINDSTVAEGTFPFNQAVQYWASDFLGASTKYPAVSSNILTGLKFDSVVPLTFILYNQTNVQQTQQREIRLQVVERVTG